MTTKITANTATKTTESDEVSIENIVNNNTIKVEKTNKATIKKEEEKKEKSVEPVAAASAPVPVVESVETPKTETIDENRNAVQSEADEEVAREETKEVVEEKVEKEVPTTATTTQVKPMKSAASRSMEKSLITYDEDQWSPANPDGKKKYSLSQLRDLCKSELVKKPELPQSIANALLPSGKPMQNRNNNYSSKSAQFINAMGLLPSFAAGGDRGGGGQMKYTANRTSQQGNKRGEMSGKSNSRSKVPQRHSYNQPEVKLNEAENAWKPRHLQSETSRDETGNEELFKRFRSTMNKLTPENFNVLLNELLRLKIDTVERLRGCISLVFEKAISEPNYSRVYAEICSKLGSLRITTEEGQKPVTFKSHLLTQCQNEFEKHKQDTSGQSNKKLLIDEEKNETKRKQLKEEYEEEQFKIRHRAIGTVRFIGELYKMEQLNNRIMHSCIQLLLDNEDEDSLECLCKLLTTIGKSLESKEPKCLDSYFAKLESIANKQSHIEVSSRIR